MSKSLEQQIIANNERMKKIQNEQKQLRQKQRAVAEKERKICLYNRGAYIEKIAPQTADMTNSQYEDYINKIFSPDVKLAQPLAEMQGGNSIKEGFENDEK